MPVLALGYIGVDARDFDSWRAFGTDVLAMQVVERGADAMALRMDERCQRVLVQRADRDGPAFFGFETASAQALQDVIGKVEAAGVRTTRATEGELLLRRVEDMAWCLDPAGNRIELFHGQTLGRHSNDWVLSFYVFCPAGFMMEYGWGGRVIDETTWTPREVSHGGSMWGRDRLWLPEERRREANDVRRSVILSGLGAPLQITRGQYDEVE